ncbi:MAG: hypothetical protein ABIP64_04290 [Burkholderiales bacterium]
MSLKKRGFLKRLLGGLPFNIQLSWLCQSPNQNQSNDNLHRNGSDDPHGVIRHKYVGSFQRHGKERKVCEIKPKNGGEKRLAASKYPPAKKTVGRFDKEGCHRDCVKPHPEFLVQKKRKYGYILSMRKHVQDDVGKDPDCYGCCGDPLFVHLPHNQPGNEGEEHG